MRLLSCLSSVAPSGMNDLSTYLIKSRLHIKVLDLHQVPHPGIIPKAVFILVRTMVVGPVLCGNLVTEIG